MKLKEVVIRRMEKRTAGKWILKISLYSGSVPGIQLTVRPLPVQGTVRVLMQPRFIRRFWMPEEAGADSIEVELVQGKDGRYSVDFGRN